MTSEYKEFSAAESALKEWGVSNGLRIIKRNSRDSYHLFECAEATALRNKLRKEKKNSHTLIPLKGESYPFKSKITINGDKCGPST